MPITINLTGLDDQLAQIEARLAALEQAKNTPVKKQLYTTEEAAAALNVSTRQISRYIDRGVLKRTGVDKKNQFTAASIEALQHAPK